MKVIINYSDRTVEEEYTKTQYYCPACGCQNVWMEEGQGDYYLGTDYVCSRCGTKSCLDLTSYTPQEGSIYGSVWEQLAKGDK